MRWKTRKAVIQVNIKAGGAIAEYVPGGSKIVEVAIDSSINSVLEQLGIPSGTPLMVIVNNDLVPASNYATHSLAQDDKISLVQPIQAG